VIANSAIGLNTFQCNVILGGVPPIALKRPGVIELNSDYSLVIALEGFNAQRFNAYSTVSPRPSPL